MTFVAIVEDQFTVDVERTATETAAFEAGAAHAGPNPLDDQAALQFRNGGDDDRDGAPQRAAGVEVLAEADELDVEMVEIVEYFEEVPDRARQAIAGPDHDDLKLAAAGVFQ